MAKKNQKSDAVVLTDDQKLKIEKETAKIVEEYNTKMKASAIVNCERSANDSGFAGTGCEIVRAGKVSNYKGGMTIRIATTTTHSCSVSITELTPESAEHLRQQLNDLLR